MTFLYKAEPVRGAAWARIFAAELPNLPFHIWPETGEPDQVRFMAVWQPPADFSRFPNLELLFSVGAGVDQFDLGALPPDLPVIRMVEPELAAGMAEYTAMAVLTLHRGLPAYLARQRAAEWRAEPVPQPAARRVGVMGLGVLGRAVLERLTGLGFSCAGWSRSPHDLPGIACHACASGLPGFLASSDILICLLPLTDETRGILNASLFAALPRGASIVNVARGAHLVTGDLLASLESEQISAAVLDVTDPEPPPPGHPFWSHPRIWLTPHIASTTWAESGAAAIVANLRRHQRGEALIGQIDRAHGY